MAQLAAYLTKMKRVMLPLGITWLILLFAFTATMIAVHLIPASAVMSNTTASVSQLYEIPQSPDTPLIPHTASSRHIYRPYHSRHDTHRRHFASNRRCHDELHSCQRLQFDNTKKIFGEGPAEDYARYWQGHQLPARIAMTFTTLKPLLIFNTVTGIILFIAVVISMWRRIAARHALTFAAFIILSGFPPDHVVAAAHRHLFHNILSRCSAYLPHPDSPSQHAISRLHSSP